MMKRIIFKLCVYAVFLGSSIQGFSQDHSIAREWNEEILHAIRNDFARPTVHARNLWHSSIIMYDVWAVLDSIAEPYFLGQTVGGFDCPFDGFNFNGDKDAAIHEAISYGIYRLMVNRFINSPGAGAIFNSITQKMQSHFYNTGNMSVDYQSGDPAALGNYIAQKIIEFGLQDNSNQQMGYANQFYMPVNSPLVVEFPGAGTLNDPNRWQPLTLETFIDQSGNEIPFNTPAFLSPEWGKVTAFSLTPDDLTIYNRDGNDYYVYHDPKMPPQISLTEDNESSDQFKWGFSMVSIWGSHLDPSDGVMIDISPGTFGNSPPLPTDFAEYPDFYDYIDGGDASLGHALNPHTGEPYAPNLVPRGDYARVLAEFWADGPDSETPPGHWFTLINYVNDHPDFERRYKGKGPVLSALEWEVKSYFALGSAMHDCAVTAWGIKGYYDYLRPISGIRSMADRGQSSDPNLPNYDIGGIPLLPGLIELVGENDTLVGENMEHLNKIKLYTWKGPEFIEEPATDEAGVGWILAENWWPYQRPSFVTPPFAGYISGHSTFSRAAADLLADITGDPFFPGGMGEFIAEKNEFLVFEEGPSQDIVLQWATYQDASDQTSLSRIWGGIHPPADDIPGRLIGMEIANDVMQLAETYFFKDQDQDGYYNYEDCDDLDASINPGASETCDGIDNNCKDGIDENLPLFSYYLDFDEDGFGDIAFRIDTCMSVAPTGYVVNSNDCDDLRNEVNPSLSEVCDGLDNDCSGVIDDGLQIFRYYTDKDNDGYGDAAIFIDTCLTALPVGYSVNELDCDDNNPNINPGVLEVCDGIDNDCSGISDDNLPLNRYYMDNDGDGFGNAAIMLDTCLMSPPNGFTINELDCDDSNPDINPAVAEICDGIDNDCSGISDDNLPLHRYYLDDDGDGYGDAAIFLDTCLTIAPLLYVVDQTDCDDGDAAINPVSTETCDGIDNDCNGLIDDGLATFRYYLDNDFDGYGNEDVFLDTCLMVAPADYVDDATDCDDNNLFINPGITEIADDGIDQDCSGLDLFLESKIFPNPVRDFLRVHYASSTTLTVSIYDIQGKEIMRSKMSINDNNFQIRTSTFQAGMYFLVIYDLQDKELYSSTFIKA